MFGPDVMKRCGANDPIHEELRRTICVPTKRYLWVPDDAITFIPGLSNTIYGDGRALYTLSTINSRPAFYVIRCCSSWAYSNWHRGPEITFGEMTDEILTDLEQQFGRARLDSEEDDPDILEDGEYPWPAVNDEGGCSWGQMYWPEKQFDSRLDGLLLKREYASEDTFARWSDDGGRDVDRPRYR